MEKRSVFIFMLAIVCGASYSATTPPTNRISPGGAVTAMAKRTSALDSGAITVALVKPWGKSDNTLVVWASLAANWQNFGDIPIHFIDIADPFSFETLVASNADVILLSDCAGGGHGFNPIEIDAVSAYAKAGHGVVGTYVIFQYNSFDNRALCPLFGFSADSQYANVPTTPTFETINDAILSTGVSKPYISAGYPFSQVPASGNWADVISNRVTVTATSSDGKSIITLYTADTYTALYASYMPEYNGNTYDMHLLYNMLTYPALDTLPTQYARKDSLLKFSIVPGVDSLNYAYFPIRVPSGMSVSQGGTVSWRPTTDSIYTASVLFKIMDDNRKYRFIRVKIMVNVLPPVHSRMPLRSSTFTNRFPIVVKQEGQRIEISPPAFSPSLVEIFTCSGRMIYRLVYAGQSKIVWNCMTFSGKQATAGKYFIRIRGEGIDSHVGVMVH